MSHLSNSITLLIIFAAITGILFYLRRRSNESAHIQENARQFVNMLQELGYFKYAAADDLSTLRKTMMETFDPHGELVTVWNDNTTIPKDYRYYPCNGEALYEQGGFMNMLQTLQPTFDKIGLVMDITAHHEEWDTSNNWLNHTITINNHQYTIFKNFVATGRGEATQRLADILNNELELQQKEDRVYLANGGNDGRLIFLTEHQFSYIDSIYKNKYRKPLTVKDWCKVMQVIHILVLDPINYSNP